eukprot:1637585-Lingulodinium_polyedra.AAC.1
MVCLKDQSNFHAEYQDCSGVVASGTFGKNVQATEVRTGLRVAVNVPRSWRRAERVDDHVSDAALLWKCQGCH